MATIDDPEMPISIVELGIILRVNVDGGVARIDLTPTFTGCPALDMIDAHIRAKVGMLDDIDRVEIEHVFDPPWSAQRISESGRARLKEHGVTVPGRKYVQLSTAAQEVVACPFCASTETHLDSPFGPTRCRVIYYCDSCRNSFEHLKAI